MDKSRDMQHISNDKGMATVEALPLLVIYVMLISYAMGIFGSIHTAILYNIHARTYAFETFRNRSDLTYFRGNADSNFIVLHYRNNEIRLHGIHDGTTAGAEPDWRATRRTIKAGTESGDFIGNDPGTHGNKINNIGPRNREVGVNPIWVRVLYGICVTSNCGD